MDVFGVVIFSKGNLMKILFYLAHPAHYHLFKNVIEKLNSKNYKTLITIKKKDVLEQLLIENNLPYFNILPKGRKKSAIGIFEGVIKRSLKHFAIIKQSHVDMIISSSAELGPIARLFNIPFINVFEDDLTLFPNYSKILGPFVDTLIVPKSCNTGKLENKTIKYDGYQELAYLGPGYFTPDYSKVEKYFDLKRKNFIIRFAQLTAWHDNGVFGLTESIAEKVIETLEPHGNILISSEIVLNSKHERYFLNIPASDMHHVLFYADMFIGDSQTMAAEAAVLGTPSLRFNDFVGKLGYLEELEHKYGLTYGIKTSDPGELLKKIKDMLSTPDLKQEWQHRRQKMLSEKIDVTAFMVWFIENYPKSVTVMKVNPEYQKRFK